MLQRECGPSDYTSACSTVLPGSSMIDVKGNWLFFKAADDSRQRAQMACYRPISLQAHLNMRPSPSSACRNFFLYGINSPFLHCSYRTMTTQLLCAAGILIFFFTDGRALNYFVQLDIVLAIFFGNTFGVVGCCNRVLPLALYMPDRLRHTLGLAKSM